MKVYKDANEMIKATIDIPKEYQYLNELMREKPNFNKSQGARKIYQRKEYTIYKVKHGYIVHNTNKEFKKGHSHINNFHKAKSIVDLAVRKKVPKVPMQWEIESLIRVSNDRTYINRLNNL